MLVLIFCYLLSGVFSLQFEAKKCFIVRLPVSGPNILSSASQMPDLVTFVFSRWFSGFTFCTRDSELVSKIQKSSTTIHIEEDSLFASAEHNNTTLSGSISDLFGFSRSSKLFSKDKLRKNKANISQFLNLMKSKPATKLAQVPQVNSEDSAIINHKDRVLPMYLFRMQNIGNYIFNNSLLYNFIFKIFGITHLIKLFYTYDIIYSGRGVKIGYIGCGERNCNQRIKKILNDSKSLSWNAELVEITKTQRGKIRLSDLFKALESMPSLNLFLLTISGPKSIILNEVLEKIGKKSIIIAAAGMMPGNGCSMENNNIIRVGSVNDSGNPSEFSPRGACATNYALGEDVMWGSGTAISAAIVGSAVALHLETNPVPNHQSVIQFLKNNSVFHDGMPILKVPIFASGNTEHKPKIYHTRILGLLLAILLYVLLIILIFKIILWILSL